MYVNIQSVGFTADVKLEDFVRNKIGKLFKVNDHITGVEVFLRLDKSDIRENKVVEVNIDIPGNPIFAKKQSKSFEESVDMVAGVLHRQIVKYKEKLRSK
ncbi:MAG: ribosome hibernation-promoting factor, HPF/YfiA family [Marinifilaceae bacterium]